LWFLAQPITKQQTILTMSIKMQSSLLLAALAAAPALVSAHGHVTSITINGEQIPGFEPGNPSADSVGWATTVQDNGFVLADALGDADIVCHRGATNAANSATVAAGDSITLTWDTWPVSHVGPIIDYLASCNGDCSTVEKTSLEFFKINEGGLLDGSAAPGRWVSDQMIDDGFSWTTTIPASLAPGSYVLRHEMIALHEGNRANGAQMYPQCINLEVTGTGSELPAGVVATSLYTATDPGILFNVYQANSDYPIPGPALTIGSGNGGGAPAPAPAPTPSSPAEDAPAEPTAAPVPTTLVTATSAASTPTQAPGGQGQALFAQCGGQEYTGATACAEGTCTELNPYYSQCL
jgi:cellulase